MGLFFFRKEIEREQFAQRLDSLESKIELLSARIEDITILMANEVAKQIQSAKAVDKAHETNPSLGNRIAKKTRYDRKSRYESTKFREHFLVAKYYKDQGLHYHEIADKMNELGYLSARNHRFSIHAVSDLLNNSKQIRHYDSKRDLTNAIELINRKSKFIVKQPNAKVDFLHGIQ